MRIFLFSTVYFPKTGGIQRVVHILASSLTELGHEVVLATETPALGSDEEAGFTVMRPPFGRRFISTLAWCDIHMQANVSLKYAWARFIFPKKFFYQLHDPHPRAVSFVDLIPRVKNYLARNTRSIAISSVPGAAFGSPNVIQNPCTLSCEGTVKCWSARSRDIVFFGRLFPNKGAHILLEAIFFLAKKDRFPRVTIIGDGPESQRLKELASDFGLDGHVEFAGYVDDLTLRQMLSEHRISVAPSLHREPFGLVALEALSAGCLPIVSADGGLVEAIGPHGLTFPNGDAHALAARLEEALAFGTVRPPLLDEVEAHLERFRPDVVAQRYINVFEHHVR
jgi:glycosyltransferase involved in cell wall biosynthesis